MEKWFEYFLLVIFPTKCRAEKEFRLCSRCKQILRRDEQTKGGYLGGNPINKILSSKGLICLKTKTAQYLKIGLSNYNELLIEVTHYQEI